MEFFIKYFSFLKYIPHHCSPGLSMGQKRQCISLYNENTEQKATLVLFYCDLCISCGSRLNSIIKFSLWVFLWRIFFLLWGIFCWLVWMLLSQTVFFFYQRAKLANGECVSHTVAFYCCWDSESSWTSSSCQVNHYSWRKGHKSLCTCFLLFCGNPSWKLCIRKMGGHCFKALDSYLDLVQSNYKKWSLIGKRTQSQISGPDIKRPSAGNKWTLLETGTKYEMFNIP